MAKRHVEEYYNKIADQYKEMIDSIRELEETLSENMSSFDVLDNMKKTVAPIKDSYMTLSWIMFLLNKPNNEKKSGRYANQGMRTLKKVNPSLDRSPDEILQENEDCLQNLKTIK